MTSSRTSADATTGDNPSPSSGDLRAELPWLVLATALLVVLLHANAPEVWFWFAAQVLLLLWRTLAWRARCWERRQPR